MIMVQHFVVKISPKRQLQSFFSTIFYGLFGALNAKLFLNKIYEQLTIANYYTEMLRKNILRKESKGKLHQDNMLKQFSINGKKGKNMQISI